MATRNRPIVIQIPREMRLTRNEIDWLDHAFKVQLAEVVKPGDLGPVVGNPINTTRLAVDIQVVGPSRRKPTKKPAKTAPKKGAKKRSGKPSK